jgi:multiple sugar transport system substrate-binding protein
MKRFMIILLAILIAFLIVSCDNSGKENNTTNTTDKTDTNKTTEDGKNTTEIKQEKELIINSNQSDQEPKRVFDALVEMFKKQNPDIKVTVNSFAHEEYKTLLRTWLPSKSAPDVITWFAGERMRAFVSEGFFDPIDDIFGNEGFDSYFPPAFRSASSYEGKIYFVPQSWYWWAVYYRKSVFEQFGITPPTTWEEFLAVCETLKTNGVTPIAIGTRMTWTSGGWFDYLNLRVNGIDFHTDVTAGKVPYTDERIKKALSYLGELSDNGYFLENHSSYAWQEAASFLYSGTAGMYLMGQFIKDSTDDQEVKDDLDFFRFPIIDPSIGLYEDTPLDGFMMPNNAKNKENAKKFLKFIASDEAQSFYARELGRLAGNKNVTAPDDHAKKGLDMVLASDGVMQFYDRDSNPEMANKGMDGIVEFMNNTTKLDIILNELEKERIRIYNIK